MIRMVQRQLIIPRGDTGTFSIPPLAEQTNQVDAFIFTIFNPREHKKIFEKVMSFSNGVLTLELTHGDTVNLPIGSYVWDIKFYKNAVIVDGVFIDGDEIDSYYAAYKLPVCEIRQTGDALLTADDAPTSTVNPEQLNIITAAAREIHDATITVTEAAQTATEKAGEAAASAEAAAASEQVVRDLIPTLAPVATSGAYSDLTGVPTNVSDFTNDAGYLTTETDPTVPAWAKESTKPSYNVTEITNAASASTLQSEIDTRTLADIELSTRLDNIENHFPSVGKFVANNTTEVTANYGSAIGYNTTVTALYGYAEGYNTIANANAAHAEGEDNYASGYASHAEGGSNLANGLYAHVEGMNNEATRRSQHVFGEYNRYEMNGTSTAQRGTYVEIVGNGTAIQRSNARTLDWDGNETLAGDLTTGNGTSVNGLATRVTALEGINPVTDVQINSTSIVNNGIANIPYASSSVAGTIKTSDSIGITNGVIEVNSADSTLIAQESETHRPIVPSNQHEATFYGLAKAAGDTTQAASENIVGTYTDDAKIAIRTMLGAGTYTKPSGGIPGTDLANAYLDISLKGAVNGLAELDANGKVPTSQLPAYVDDVIEVDNFAALPVTGESGKIYVIKDDNKTYRWSGSAYVEISASLALGETDSTAYRGDRGAAAYAHAVMNKGSAFSSGLYKITTNSEGHVTAAAAVEKADITALGIPAQDTTYESKSAASGGTDVSLVTTGEKYNWNSKYDKPSGGIPGSDLAETYLTEHQSLSNYVQKTDYATSSTAGIAKVQATYGITIGDSSKLLMISRATTSDIKAGTNAYKPITSEIQHYAAFYGLSKAAGIDLANETITFGTYPETSKIAIRSMIGAAATSDIPSIPVTDVQVNSTSIVNSGTANIPMATADTFGVVKVGSGSDTTGESLGLYRQQNGLLRVASASSATVKNGSHSYQPIAPATQHQAVFYGLSKVAGVDLANETVTLGTYPETAKSAINTMIGSVSKVSLENAGITSKTYTTLFGGQFSVTTAVSSDYISPYARASITGRISKYYRHRVTFNGTQYILKTGLWFANNKVYEYLGDLNLFISDTTGVPQDIENVPFLIISDFNGSSSIDVFTSDAGTYTILVEQITPTQIKLPEELIYGNTYIPLETKANDGTYSGFSIGVNELKNSRGTIALGYNNSLSQDFAMSMGYQNTVSGMRAMALGGYNTVSSNSSIAIGEDNNITASGGMSLGNKLTVNGQNMVAVGIRNVAANNVTFSNWTANTHYNKGDLVKVNLISTVWFNFVCNTEHTSSSSFNNDAANWTIAASDKDTVFVVGNGGSLGASNALKVDLAGNTYIGGNLFVDCDPSSANGSRVAKLSDIPSVPVTDVQVYGTSILSSGIANIPRGSASTYGVVKVSGDYGISMRSDGALRIEPAGGSIKVGTTDTFAITPAWQHASVFFGLAKIAGADLKEDSTVSVTNLVYPDATKTAIRSMLGAVSATDYASSSTGGVIKITGTNGIGINSSNGYTYIVKADSSTIKSGSGNYAPIVAGNQHEAVFYGLAKAAGDASQASSTNTVGTYTNDAKSAIRSMIGAVGNTEQATSSTYGVVKLRGAVRSGADVAGGIADAIYINSCSLSATKGGVSDTFAVSPSVQHGAVFYGLSKAAGVDLANETVTLGTYPDTSKNAIRNMLEVAEGSEINLDLSQQYSGYPTGDIDAAISFASSTRSYTYKKCAWVNSGTNYTIRITNGASPASTDTRVARITNENDIIKQTINVTTTASETNLVKFIANASGWLYLPVDINATEIQMIGGTPRDLSSSLAPEEHVKASTSHGAGRLLMMDGQLYKATSAIASGETITPGTNVTATSVAALFTPTVGAPTYVQNNYIESVNFAASYYYKYPIGIAIISLRFAVTASLTSTNVKFGELGFSIPVETRVSITNQSDAGSCLVTIGTDGSLNACAYGTSKPSGWGVYNVCITLPYNS